MSDYTPGPWAWEWSERYCLLSPTREVLRFWSKHADDDGVDVSDADARLISKSPEMADLLRDLVADTSSGVVGGDDTAILRIHAKAAAAILASIDGDTPDA